MFCILIAVNLLLPIPIFCSLSTLANEKTNYFPPCVKSCHCSAHSFLAVLPTPAGCFLSCMCRSVHSKVLRRFPAFSPSAQLILFGTLLLYKLLSLQTPFPAFGKNAGLRGSPSGYYGFKLVQPSAHLVCSPLLLGGRVLHWLLSKTFKPLFHMLARRGSFPSSVFSKIFLKFLL